MMASNLENQNTIPEMLDEIEAALENNAVDDETEATIAEQRALLDEFRAEYDAILAMDDEDEAKNAKELLAGKVTGLSSQTGGSNNRGMRNI